MNNLEFFLNLSPNKINTILIDKGSKNNQYFSEKGQRSHQQPKWNGR